jgi:hypothetical protein
MRKIREYFIMKKIEKYSSENSVKTENKTRKKIPKLLITYIILGILIIGINYKYQNKLYFTISIASYFGILILNLLIIKIQKVINKGKISKLYLLDENDKKIKKWDIKKHNSLLIGKNTEDNQVDIDLSDVQYSLLVSRAHAVLNKNDSGWYFEDVGSSNGSGIKKNNENERFKIYPGEIHKLEQGDILFIANTKLLVK